MLETQRLSPNIGVQVKGLDLAMPISAADGAELRNLLHKHRVLLFRQGPITEGEQLRLLGAIGRVIPEHKGVIAYVSTDPGQYVSGTYRLSWHSDYQFTPTGALEAISLYAMEMERNEPTLFADMVRAAATLPQDLRREVEGLQVVQCLDWRPRSPNAPSPDELTRSRLSQKKPDTPDWHFPCATHPVLGRHPYTGEEMLNVSQSFTSHIVGKTDAESDAIFAKLEPYQYPEDQIYAHKWQVNDLVIWDNVALQHSRDALGKPAGRKLRRVTINPLSVVEMLPDHWSDRAA